MNVSKKNIIYFFIVIIIAYFLASYQLPYYIQRPGNADELDPIVEVENGTESEGQMHLVTVSGLQATPIQYVWAKIFPHNEILPIEEVFPEGLDQDDYMHAQLQLMENSQEASTVAAYQAAGEEITIDYRGVYVVSVIEGMPAEGKLEPGDVIVAVDGQKVEKSEDLTEYVNTKEEGDTIVIDYIRENDELTVELGLESFDETNEKRGIGISLVTDREVDIERPVEFSSGSIGGPSAGLMFALEIYDQLTEEDLTKGYNISGTGEIDYEGNIHPVGGVDKKIVAADRSGVDVFFALYDQGETGSNYEVAKKAAEEIDTEMEIVPVDNLDDALSYLKNLQPK